MLPMVGRSSGFSESTQGNASQACPEASLVKIIPHRCIPEVCLLGVKLTILSVTGNK